MWKTLAAGLGLALLVGAWPMVQAQKKEEVREKETTRTTTKVRKVSAVMGSEVRLKEGALGKVTDVVFDENGCIGFLIVRDEGEEYVAVPWGAVRYEAGEKTITVTTTVTREKLKSVRFRSSDWPDFYSEKWTRNAGEVWGEKSLRRHHDARRDDTRGDDKRDDARRDDRRRDDERRKDDLKKDDDRRRDDDRRKDDLKKDDRRNDDQRKDDLKKDDKRRDDDKRKDDQRKDDQRKDDQKKDDNKRKGDDKRKDDQKKDNDKRRDDDKRKDG